MKSLSLSKKLCHFGPAVQTTSNSKCRFNQVDNSPCVMHVCLLHMYSIRGINNPHVITHHLYNWKNKQLHKTTKQQNKPKNRWRPPFYFLDACVGYIQSITIARRCDTSIVVLANDDVSPGSGVFLGKLNWIKLNQT